METTVRVTGLREVRTALRKAGGPALSKSLQRAHKSIAERVVEAVKPAVASLPSPGGSRAVGGITPRASQTSAEIAFSQAARAKPLMATILGSNWHPVFGRFVPADSMKRRLWSAHLGASWDPFQLYGVGPVLIRAERTFVLQEYEEAINEAIREAGFS